MATPETKPVNEPQGTHAPCPTHSGQWYNKSTGACSCGASHNGWETRRPIFGLLELRPVAETDDAAETFVRDHLAGANGYFEIAGAFSVPGVVHRPLPHGELWDGKDNTWITSGDGSVVVIAELAPNFYLKAAAPLYDTPYICIKHLPPDRMVKQIIEDYGCWTLNASGFEALDQYVGGSLPDGEDEEDDDEL